VQRFFARNSLLLAVAFGLAGAVLLYLAIQSMRKDTGGPVQTAPVLVARVDIPARSAITRDQVTMIDLPVDARHPRALTSVGDVVGKYTNDPIFAGEQVLNAKVADKIPGSALSSRVPEGRRAVGVNVNEASTVGGLIGPGDRVDVIAVLKQDRLGVNAASVILQDIQVLAVAQTIIDREDRQPKVDDSPAPATGAKTVTLAVTLDEAQRLALAEEFGVLRLALRRTDDKSITNSQELTLNAVSR
jgi:pilus assembly protein CpaB